MPPKSVPPKGPGSDEPFTYETSLTNEDDTPYVITVPSMAVMPKPNQFKFLRLQKADRTGVLATDYLLELGIGRELMDELERLPGDESLDFMTKWSEHSGVALGESRAS
jgi:hypothetical protein